MRINPTVREIVIALVTAAATTSGMYFQFRSHNAEMGAAEASARADQLSVIFRRITDLEVQVSSLQTRIVDLTAENVQLDVENTQLKVEIGLLRAQVDYGDGSQLDGIFKLLESLDVPAWCKVFVETPEPHLEMGYINSNFEFTYGISKARYIGSTDFDVHPVEIAKAYNENDFYTYKARGWADFTESVILPDGTRAKRRFWKFYHKVKNGPELICGWEVAGN